MTRADADAAEVGDVVVRTTVDDETFARLAVEAEERGLGLDELIVALLSAASRRVPDLLGDASA